MNITVLIRTLNEADKIAKCCEAYQFADHILIADGGSTDNTVSIADTYPKVQVRLFDQKVECSNGIWRNPDGAHLNFLYEWAESIDADWVISQDCDQRPNFYLKRDVREILEKTDKMFLLGVQIFLWKNTHYFPNLSKGDTKFMHLPNLSTQWSHGIWAWRGDAHIRAIDEMPHYMFTVNGKDTIDFQKEKSVEVIDPPYCYMHFGWETDDEVNALLEYYDRSGLIPNMVHPLKFGGPTMPIEDWMIE